MRHQSRLKVIPNKAQAQALRLFICTAHAGVSLCARAGVKTGRGSRSHLHVDGHHTHADLAERMHARNLNECPFDCRNTPIPLSLFGEEEEEDLPNAAPVLDLAALWGGFMLPIQPVASAVQSLNAAQQPVQAGTARPDPAASSPAHAESSDVDRCSDAAAQPTLAMQAPHVAPEAAASMPPDSWDAANAEALPPAPAVSRALSKPRGSDGCSQALVSAAPENAPSVCAGGTNDPTDSQQASRAPGEAGTNIASAAQVALPKPEHSIASGSIDWDSLDFDFGPVGNGHCTAEEPASQHAAVDEGKGTGTVISEGSSAHISHVSIVANPAEAAEPAAWPSAQSGAMQISSTHTHSSLSCNAEPMRDGEAGAAASDEDEWGFGEYEAAAVSSLGVALAAADADGVHSVDQENSWGVWDALGGAAASVEQPEQESPMHQARLSAQLAPAGSQGSALLEFDQWGRAYSALETQAAAFAAASSRKAAVPPASTSDVWASLAALEEAHMAAAGMEAAPAQLPPPEAHAAISEQAHGAFASFDALLEEDPLQQQAASPSLVTVEAEHVSPPKQEAQVDTASGSTPGTLEQAQPSGQAAVRSAGAGNTAELAAQRSWGEGWADSMVDVPGGQPAQAAWAMEPGTSWKARQEADLALEQALGCDRQAALLCLVQVGSPLPRCGSLEKSHCRPGHRTRYNSQAAVEENISLTVLLCRRWQGY